MVRRATPLSRAFFLELIMVLTIFAICAVICLQVFAAANTESDRSLAITEIGIMSQKIAEGFKAHDGSITSLEVTKDAERSGDTYSWYFDDKLNTTAADKARFVLSCSIQDQNDLKVAELTLSEGQSELFSYNVSKYVGLRGVR